VTKSFAPHHPGGVKSIIVARIKIVMSKKPETNYPTVVVCRLYPLWISSKSVSHTAHMVTEAYGLRTILSVSFSNRTASKDLTQPHHHQNSEQCFCLIVDDESSHHSGWLITLEGRPSLPNTSLSILERTRKLLTMSDSTLEFLSQTASKYYAAAGMTVRLLVQQQQPQEASTEAAEPTPPSPSTEKNGTSVVAEAWACIVLVGLVLVLLIASAIYSSCTTTNPCCFSWCHWKKRRRWREHQQVQRQRQIEQQVALQRMALARQRAAGSVVLRGGGGGGGGGGNPHHLQERQQGQSAFSFTSSLSLSEQQRYMLEVELRRAELLRSCILSSFEVNQVQMVSCSLDDDCRKKRAFACIVSRVEDCFV
jgi:hypothetical protein